MSRSILITGPSGHAEDWCQPVNEAGFEATAWPLVEVAPLEHDLVNDIDGLPDWLCLTSPNAVPALEAACQRLPELRSVPAAVVGPRSAEAVEAMGIKVVLRGEGGARPLAEALIQAAPGAQCLWPRGNLATELADLLREGGLNVHAPVVYETRSVQRDEAPPLTDVVFFASPSAVRTWPMEQPRSLAIAIGTTTLGALDEFSSSPFHRHLALEAPRPGALVKLLSTL